MRRLLVTAIAATTLATLAWAMWPMPSSTATAAQPRAAVSVAPPEEVPTASRPPAQRGGVSQVTYRLDLVQRVTIGGGRPIEVGVTGDWIVTPSADGELTVRLADAELTGPLPLDPAELEWPMGLRTGPDGTLAAVGFAQDPAPIAHRILVGIASGAWFTPGVGARWIAVEADRAGRYEAVYGRRADGAISRTRTAYLALHGPHGALHTRGVGDLSISGQTAFAFDRSGLVRVHQSERIVSAPVTSQIGEARPRAVAEVEMVLERIDRRRVSATPSAEMRFGPLEQTVDSGVAAEALDRNRVGDATVAGLVAELGTATTDGLTGPDRSTYSRAMGRLAAALRLDPGMAGQVADAARAASDPAVTGLLTGALSGAGNAEASAALAALLDEGVDDTTRTQAMVNLGRSDYAGPETIDAIAARLDGDLDGAAAFALGTQSKRLMDDDPDVAGQAAGTLLDRFAAAESSDTRRAALEALANSGDPRLLPIIEDTLKTDATLAATAAYALRFVPGNDADLMLDDLLTRPNTPAVWQGAVRAIAFRDGERWRAPLDAALDHPMYDAQTRALIENILARER